MASGKSVIVVGAGPVGLLTGLRCAKAGIHTTVLEALPSIENSPRAAVYAPVAVQELDRAGVLADCRAIGLSSSKISFRKIDGEEIAGLDRPPGTEDSYENLILGQHELAEVIMKHLEECGEIGRVLFEHRVVGIKEEGDEAVVEVETGKGRKEMRATYVVGADGGRSTVRKLAGVEWEGFTWDVQIVATNVVYPFDKFGYSTGNQIVHPDHFAVIALLNRQGLWRVSYAEKSGLSDEELRKRLEEKYEALFPGPRPLKYDLKMFSPYLLHQKCASSFRVGRILLAGDAAHICNPFGGLGLTGGLLDAGALGDALTVVLTKGHNESILDKYAQVRRDVFLNVINPASQGNLRRLWKTDPETVGDTDPFFRSLRESDPAAKEKMRGLGELRIDILQNDA